MLRTLGVSAEGGLRAYPLNLMQLVLPKEKVKAASQYLSQSEIQFISTMNMNIRVNNKAHQIPHSQCLNVLIGDLIKEKQNGIAVAVNNKVVSMELWNTTLLNENDHVTIIQATQGG